MITRGLEKMPLMIPSRKKSQFVVVDPDGSLSTDLAGTFTCDYNLCMIRLAGWPVVIFSGGELNHSP